MVSIDMESRVPKCGWTRKHGCRDCSADEIWRSSSASLLKQVAVPNRILDFLKISLGTIVLTSMPFCCDLLSFVKAQSKSSTWRTMRINILFFCHLLSNLSPVETTIPPKEYPQSPMFSWHLLWNDLHYPISNFSELEFQPRFTRIMKVHHMASLMVD